MMERKYGFRNRLDVVHKPNRRDPHVQLQDDELEITDEWRIVIGEHASELLAMTAEDLQDYLYRSMNVSVRLARMSDLAQAAQSANNVIILGTKAELPEYGYALETARSYRIVAEQNRIVVCGHEHRGAAQGGFYLEDLMNLREAPYLSPQDISREPLFSPRMAHSGWGLDKYPDAHLNAMAHAGIDAILVFVKDVDCTPEGYLDFNHLIERAALYGLDVYAYSYLISRKHPDEPDAEDYYDSTYGKLFAACPGFKGVILVGESCEFPSKDPNTTGMLRLEWPADKPQTKPSPGWWPCTDYPQWLSLLKKTVHKHNPEAEIVFWTYNWGWAPEEERLKLIHALPEGITLQVTFEMFEQIKHESVTNVCVDYTVSFAGPGKYFSSEAAAAKERGIKLYTMSNTGGMTWDIGVIPYEPFPHQWVKRHEALLQARAVWGLSGLMESHHFGWWPSFVSEMTKWNYWRPSPSYEEVLASLARRDFGPDAEQDVLEAWKLWSEAIQYYIPTNEDQYGPFRVGPSYPLVFKKPVQIPAASHAMFGNEIVMTTYEPQESERQSLGIARFPVEIRSLARMLELMQQGNERLAAAVGKTPPAKQEDAARMLGLGRFIAAAVQTTLNVKQWWLLKQQLFAEPSSLKAELILKQMEALAEAEIANAEAAKPLVAADSRLGWEPSMDYMTDVEHLEWKIRQVQSVVDSEFAAYRKALALTE
ncbi:hypothetical protein [Paenibacillus sp. GCM10027626]|uniref:hypothetical protein n=1 Tax=Paenibacillus sp. GCM10027626 TaxID=3273411 RepID=UPI00363CBBEE